MAITRNHLVQEIAILLERKRVNIQLTDCISLDVDLLWTDADIAGIEKISLNLQRQDDELHCWILRHRAVRAWNDRIEIVMRQAEELAKKEGKVFSSFLPSLLHEADCLPRRHDRLMEDLHGE